MGACIVNSERVIVGIGYNGFPRCVFAQKPGPGRAADAAAAQGLRELYVAPMYNLLIRRGCDIRYHLIGAEEVIFCGVPAEYEAFLAAPPTAAGT